MRRVYLKPEIRNVHLCLNTFITSSGNGVNYGIGYDGQTSTDPITEAKDKDEDAPSRWFRDDIWDD